MRQAVIAEHRGWGSPHLTLAICLSVETQAPPEGDTWEDGMNHPAWVSPLTTEAAQTTCSDNRVISE